MYTTINLSQKASFHVSQSCFSIIDLPYFWLYWGRALVTYLLLSNIFHSNLPIPFMKKALDELRFYLLKFCSLMLSKCGKEIWVNWKHPLWFPWETERETFEYPTISVQVGIATHYILLFITTRKSTTEPKTTVNTRADTVHILSFCNGTCVIFNFISKTRFVLSLW